MNNDSDKNKYGKKGKGKVHPCTGRTAHTVEEV
jgi:hypothetical protein